jgi:hypothetical protein
MKLAQIGKLTLILAIPRLDRGIQKQISLRNRRVSSFRPYPQLNYQAMQTKSRKSKR